MGQYTGPGQVMQTSTIALALLVLFLHQGEATVTSCVYCESEPSRPNPDCAEGNDNLPRVKCGDHENAGCYAFSMFMDKGVYWMDHGWYWGRGCCDSDGCKDEHSSINGNTQDVGSCSTDNCNTMNPMEI